MPRKIALAIVVAAAALTQGCATYYSVPVRASGAPSQAGAPVAMGLSIGELLQMLKAGRPQNDIINDLKGRGLRAQPAPADYDVMLAAGATPELMQALQTAAAYTGTQVDNGGVGYGPIAQEQVTVYQETYPWVPFGLGLGLGLGYYGGGYWGYPYARGYAPVRPFAFSGPRIAPAPGGYGRGFPRSGFFSRRR